MELLIGLDKILNESDRRRYSSPQQQALGGLLLLQRDDISAILLGCRIMADELRAGYEPRTDDDFIDAELKRQLRSCQAVYVRYRMHLWYYEAVLRHYNELCEAGFDCSQAAIYTQARVYHYANWAQTLRKQAIAVGYDI